MSRSRRIGEEIDIKIGIRPAAQAAATVNGPAITRNGAASCVLHQASGAVTGAPTSFIVAAKLQDSADGSTGWADISGAAPADLTAVNTEAEKNIDLTVSTKGFVRVVQTVSFVGGTSPTIAAEATVALGGIRKLPA